MKKNTLVTVGVSLVLLLNPVMAQATSSVITPRKPFYSAPTGGGQPTSVAGPRLPFTYVSPTDAGNSAIDEASRHGKLLMRVLFLGAIAQGIHYFPERTDLLTCVMYVGGYDENAQLSSIQIRRKGVKDLLDIDLEELIEEGDVIPPLEDGDIVTIDWNWRKDLELYYTLTGFLTSVTGFTISIIALSK